MKKIIFVLYLSFGFTILMGQNLPDDIDISGSETGVIVVPDYLPSIWTNNFSLYTKYITPNGGSIHFIGQSNISEEQMIYSREVLAHYLTDLPGSQYGSDKSEVANVMAENNAQMIIYNGYHGEFNVPEINGQWLFEDEITVLGTVGYTTNDYNEHRDATFEEVLHMVHDFGIGVSGSWPFVQGALPEYQEEIYSAMENALPSSMGGNNLWGIEIEPGIMDWLEELENEGSLSQEYLASVIDSYYGLWGAFGQGMWGIYIASTREEIQELDPMGWALLDKFFSPMLMFEARIDQSFMGTFKIHFDENTDYTHKSQYIQFVRLTGSNHSNLMGNDYNNRLRGNNGNNTLSGGLGDDTAIFQGNYSEYLITNLSDNEYLISDLISGRDGEDTVIDIEYLEFSDLLFELASLTVSTIEIPTEYVLHPAYPNPFNPVTTLSYDLSEDGVVNITIYDLVGRHVRMLLDSPQTAGHRTIQWNATNNAGQQVPGGVYLYRIQAGQFRQTKKMILLK